VYTTLCLAVLVSALGAYAHMLTHLGGLLTTAGFIGCTMWLMSTPAYEEVAFHSACMPHISAIDEMIQSYA
jgi:hypothetical protein